MRVLLFERLQPYLQIIGGYSYGQYLADLTPMIDGGFRFSTRVPGLHYRFTAKMSKDAASLYEYFQNYIGARIVVFDDYGMPVWDGILWETDISIGNNSLGPLTMDWLANYCAVEYADILDNGKYALTSYKEDGASFDRYGLIERVLSYGQFTSVAADNAANRYEYNHRALRLSGSLAIPVTGDDLSLEITAMGYWVTANNIKIQTYLTTTTTVQNRIKEIVDRSVTRSLTISATPQNYPYLEFFSTDTSLIDGTDLTVARYNNHADGTGHYLERLVSLGDSAYDTWYIGAEIGSYDGQLPLGKPRVKVWERPTSPQFFVDAARWEVRNTIDEKVSPFAVRAGDSIMITGIIPVSSAQQIPVFGDNTFVIQETNYDSQTGILTATPEGGDQDVEIIIARMAG